MQQLQVLLVRGGEGIFYLLQAMLLGGFLLQGYLGQIIGTNAGAKSYHYGANLVPAELNKTNTPASGSRTAFTG